jgi:LysM repeat protein
MKIRLLLLLILVIMPSVLFAASQDEPTIYVIKQGDTLWGLSERFIKDPKYWPNMWSKNGQVTNPHFIYPGQKLRIFPDRLEIVSKEEVVTSVAEVPVPKAAPVETVAEAIQQVAAEKTYTIYGSEGLIAEKDFKQSGLIIGIQHDRIVAGLDDIVYTDNGSNQDVHGGDKFSLFQKGALVKHPVSKEEIGFKMIPLGSLQLTDVDAKTSRAIITKSTREISPGAYLLPYKDNRRREITLKNNSSDLKGYIVDSFSGASILAAGDIVFIDLGADQGAEVGNMLYIVRDVKIDKRYVEGKIDRLPQELLGALVILETGSKTSTALVVKSIDTIYKGDRIVSQTK